MGHALAAKHAGRKVPAAGFLLYFGIPSAFVDTTDVWMAGRRARLQTTAAGPAAALTLAGAAQLVGLAYPTLGAVCFKLSFAWYLNSLFNLNPLLALDGYYLLMDWLEVPNLRSRGIAYILLTFRLRRPAWSTLDREGRFVALYGVLSFLWLLTAMNLFYRVYLDRIAGLVTGLWHVGLGARVLLIAIVVGLFAPLVYTVLGWLGRRLGRVPRRLRESRRTKDLPRRLETLRVTALAGMPTETLTELARAGRWVRPRSGTPLIVAGAAPRAVYVVADGALEARAPGDATGSVRQRATAGDLIGAAPVLSGVSSSLTWTTVGTRLLALPTSRFVALAGSAVAWAGLGADGASSDRAELEGLLDAAPALAGMRPEDRIAMIATSRPIDLEVGNGHEIEPDGPAALVAAGVIAGPSGEEARRGDVLVAGGLPVAAIARTRSRLWSVPIDSGFASLFGTTDGVVWGARDGQATHTAPLNGLHPAAEYPPLQPPVGPPPDDDGATDRRLGRAGRWLALLLLLLLLLAIFGNTKPAIAWAEMPRDRALLAVVTGSAEATLVAGVEQLRAGEQRYVGRGDAILVGRNSRVRLTFRGGGRALLCAGSRVLVGSVSTVDLHPAQPAGELQLALGRAVARTETASGAFAPLALRVRDGARMIANDGPAQFAVSPGELTVTLGDVTLDGTPQPSGAALPECGGAGAIAGPAEPGPGQGEAGGGTPGGSGGPTPALSSGAGPDPTGVVGPPITTNPAPEDTQSPPVNTAPTIEWVRADSLSLRQVKTRGVCGGGPSSTQITANVHDTETPAAHDKDICT
jgi:putative peptide zinc metalloprotease protein